MSYNLADLSTEDMDKINVDLIASGVAFKERYNMPVNSDALEREQPAHLRDYFHQRVTFYRSISHQFATLPYEPKK